MKIGEFFGSMLSEDSKVSHKRVVGFGSFLMLVALAINHMITGKAVQGEILYVFAGIVGSAFGFSAWIDARAFGKNKVKDNAELEKKSEVLIEETPPIKGTTTVTPSTPVVTPVTPSVSKPVIVEPIEDADILDGLKENFKKPTTSIPVKPKNLLEAASFYIGVSEANGADSNKAILEFGKRADISWYNNDSIPWCAVFANAMCDLVGLKETKSALAKSFLSWGTKISIEEAAKDNTNVVGIFHRGDKNSGSGHVAILKDISADKKFANMLGGNQGDKVCIQRFKLDDKFITFRRGSYV